MSDQQITIVHTLNINGQLHDITTQVVLDEQGRVKRLGSKPVQPSEAWMSFGESVAEGATRHLNATQGVTDAVLRKHAKRMLDFSRAALGKHKPSAA